MIIKEGSHEQKYEIVKKVKGNFDDEELSLINLKKIIEIC